MNNNLWLLPEGIEEVLPPDAERLESLRRRILDRYKSWGYELVMPPFIEYLESLLTGTGRELDLKTFKLIDQVSGRTLGVRADMTPQIARIEAHKLRRNVPSRLCYMGTVLNTRADDFSGSRSPLQIGLEMYGHSGVASELEVISLMLETLSLAGIRDVHLDLGHVDVYRSLARQAGLNLEQEAELFDILQRKAKAELDVFLTNQDIATEQATMLAALPELNGGPEILSLARERLAAGNAAVIAALGELESVCKSLAELDSSVPVFCDLAELRGYHYHTGMVFAAFQPGHGQEIARGGRYDEIGKVFGRARPATGFSADLKTLLRLGDVTPQESQRVFAPLDVDTTLVSAIEKLRSEGAQVVQQLPGQGDEAVEMGCTHRLVLSDKNWVVTEL
jgi:ATP phosphoribosyltransferase regulatory subunit